MNRTRRTRTSPEGIRPQAQLEAYKTQLRDFNLASRLASSLERWPAYSAAALASLASQSIASADIIYYPTPVTATAQFSATTLVKDNGLYLFAAEAPKNLIQLVALFTTKILFVETDNFTSHGKAVPLPLSGTDEFIFGLSTPNSPRGFNDDAWVKLSYALTASESTITVDEWAYNNTGAPIALGQTPVPEPSSFGLTLLAVGAAGVLALRKRRQAAQ